MKQELSANSDVGNGERSSPSLKRACSEDLAGLNSRSDLDWLRRMANAEDRCESTSLGGLAHDLGLLRSGLGSTAGSTLSPVDVADSSDPPTTTSLLGAEARLSGQSAGPAGSHPAEEPIPETELGSSSSGLASLLCPACERRILERLARGAPATESRKSR